MFNTYPIPTTKKHTAIKTSTKKAQARSLAKLRAESSDTLFPAKLAKANELLSRVKLLPVK